MSTSFPTLNLISRLLKGVGILVIIFSMIGLITGISWRVNHIQEDISLFMVIGSIIFGVFGSIQYFAYSELIILLIRIESNTRNTSQQIIENSINTTSTDSNVAFSEWLKQNPNKSINDYYTAMRSKNKK